MMIRGSVVVGSQRKGLFVLDSPTSLYPRTAEYVQVEYVERSTRNSSRCRWARKPANRGRTTILFTDQLCMNTRVQGENYKK